MGNRNLPYLRIEWGNLVRPAHCCQPTTRHLCQLTTAESLQDNLPQSIHCRDNTLWVAGGRTGQAGGWVGRMWELPIFTSPIATTATLSCGSFRVQAVWRQRAGSSSWECPIFTSGSRGRGCENGAHQLPPPPCHPSCPPPNGLNTVTVIQQPEV